MTGLLLVHLLDRPRYFTVGTVAALGGCSESHVRRADDLLQPERDAIGRRLYSPQRVVEWIVERATARAPKAQR